MKTLVCCFDANDEVCVEYLKNKSSRLSKVSDHDNTEAPKASM